MPLSEVGNGKHILLIDDEIQVTAIGQEILECYGYTVTSQNCSVKAFDDFILNPFMFDLVITDVLMPNMTGLELARKIKRLRENLPIIMWTGLLTPVIENQAREIGIQKLITKPINAQNLSDTVLNIFHSTTV